jgi:putative phage-type endonuclease
MEASKFEQGSPEWIKSRLGRATASRIKDIIAKTKTGYSTSRKNYALELALERITGARQEGYTNAAMQRGTDMEPIARAAYEALTGELVEEVGLIDHPTILMTGASPDGLVGKDGLLEIKVPNSATHLDTLTSQKADPQYMPQMQWQLACTGRQWCDFVSYDERFPEHLRLFVHRVRRDDDYIAELEAEVASFLKEVDGLVEQINSL